MGILELLLTAVGLSMDAMAVSICKGFGLRKPTFKNCLVVGIYFGVFQAVMPLLGYWGGTLFHAQIETYDHWIAFGLLVFIGGRMIAGSFHKDSRNGKYRAETNALGAKEMLPLAIATSIDALAVGITFAVLNVRVMPAITLIGATTLLLSMGGVKVGGIFGEKFKTKAEFIGGVILVLIGLKILFDHAGVL
ncbi:MAG: manganese efflux pump MntP family protein [Clostridiales bacterium]|nr:manganese efflux pump MntP family protein [Clostridiales bacterium]